MKFTLGSVNCRRMRKKCWFQKQVFYLRLAYVKREKIWINVITISPYSCKSSTYSKQPFSSVSKSEIWECFKWNLQWCNLFFYLLHHTLKSHFLCTFAGFILCCICILTVKTKYSCISPKMEMWEYYVLFLTLTCKYI